MKRLPTLWALSLCCFLLPLTALAGFDEGLTAHQKGNDATAIKEWKPLAEQGDARAQYYLAEMYDTGIGVMEDPIEAARLFRLAAEQGKADAQFRLGVMYIFAVKEGDREGLRLFRHENYDGGSLRLFELDEAKWYDLLRHREGDKIFFSQNDEEAARLFQLAAKQGHIRAAFNLYIMYKRGYGVKKDDTQALRFLRLAADKGYGKALFRLGVVHEEGLLGVGIDRAEAERLFRLASAAGSQEAKHHLEWVYPNLIRECQDFCV